jgi:hypothetical protein
MKRSILILAILAIVVIGELYPVDHNQDVRLIRRLYLDSVGKVPTPEEMDWYIIYNKDSYYAAVDYISSFKPNKLNPRYQKMTRYELIAYFNSDKYTQTESRPLARKEIENIIRYSSGLKDGSLDECKDRFCSDALKVSDDFVDASDYMGMWLMGRNTNIREANQLAELSRKLKGEGKNDLETMRGLLEEMIKFESVVTK